MYIFIQCWKYIQTIFHGYLNQLNISTRESNLLLRHTYMRIHRPRNVHIIYR
jgi:hypothetical protein